MLPVAGQRSCRACDCGSAAGLAARAGGAGRLGGSGRRARARCGASPDGGARRRERGTRRRFACRGWSDAHPRSSFRRIFVSPGSFYGCELARARRARAILHELATVAPRVRLPCACRGRRPHATGRRAGSGFVVRRSRLRLPARRLRASVPLCRWSARSLAGLLCRAGCQRSPALQGGAPTSACPHSLVRCSPATREGASARIGARPHPSSEASTASSLRVRMRTQR